MSFEKVIIGDATLYLGDCLQVMPEVASTSIDAVICDLPYGTTACKWDSVIPFDPLWAQYKRVLRKAGVVVLTASQPFTSALVMSNINWFRYDWVWEKDNAKGFLNANKAPLRAHESVLVFYESLGTYNPQMIETEVASHKGSVRFVDSETEVYGLFKEYQRGGKTQRYPRSVLRINTVNAAHGVVHPTQKPTRLMEYLTLTYTNAGEVVFDNSMGSGTTGVAAIRQGRKFIGIENNPEYFDIARKRIEQAYAQGKLFEPEPPKQEQGALL